MSNLPPAPIEYVDRPELMEIFVDTINSLHLREDGARIEFCVTRLDTTSKTNPKKKKRIPACRLVLTPDATVDLINQLNHMAKTVQQERLQKKVATSKVIN